MAPNTAFALLMVMPLFGSILAGPIADRLASKPLFDCDDDRSDMIEMFNHSCDKWAARLGLRLMPDNENNCGDTVWSYLCGLFVADSFVSLDVLAADSSANSSIPAQDTEFISTTVTVGRYPIILTRPTSTTFKESTATISATVVYRPVLMTSTPAPSTITQQLLSITTTVSPPVTTPIDPAFEVWRDFLGDFPFHNFNDVRFDECVAHSLKEMDDCAEHHEDALKYDACMCKEAQKGVDHCFQPIRTDEQDAWYTKYNDICKFAHNEPLDLPAATTITSVFTTTSTTASTTTMTSTSTSTMDAYNNTLSSASGFKFPMVGALMVSLAGLVGVAL